MSELRIALPRLGAEHVWAQLMPRDAVLLLDQPGKLRRNRASPSQPLPNQSRRRADAATKCRLAAFLMDEIANRGVCHTGTIALLLLSDNSVARRFRQTV